MSQWTNLKIVGKVAPIPEGDFEIVEESALARAQACLYAAMEDAGLSQADLARRLKKSPAYVSQLLGDGRNLTIKTLARTLAACGKQFDFTTSPMEWGWAEAHQSAPHTASIIASATEGGHAHAGKNLRNKNG